MSTTSVDAPQPDSQQDQQPDVPLQRHPIMTATTTIYQEPTAMAPKPNETSKSDTSSDNTTPFKTAKASPKSKTPPTTKAKQNKRQPARTGWKKSLADFWVTASPLLQALFYLLGVAATIFFLVLFGAETWQKLRSGSFGWPSLAGPNTFEFNAALMTAGAAFLWDLVVALGRYWFVSKYAKGKRLFFIDSTSLSVLFWELVPLFLIVLAWGWLYFQASFWPSEEEIPVARSWLWR